MRTLTKTTTHDNQFSGLSPSVNAIVLGVREEDHCATKDTSPEKTTETILFRTIEDRYVECIGRRTSPLLLFSDQSINRYSLLRLTDQSIK